MQHQHCCILRIASINERLTRYTERTCGCLRVGLKETQQIPRGSNPITESNNNSSFVDADYNESIQNQLEQQMNKSVLKAGIFGVPVLWCSVATSQEPVSLAQLQHVGFGTVPAAPSRCSMSSNGLLSGDCVGTGRPGEVEVTGEPYYAYNVSVSDVGWIDDIIFRPKLNAKRFSLNGQGRDIFTVTGDLRFKPNSLRTGHFVLTYLISVDYQ